LLAADRIYPRRVQKVAQEQHLDPSVVFAQEYTTVRDVEPGWLVAEAQSYRFSVGGK
jgi:hypothetical protein